MFPYAVGLDMTRRHLQRMMGDEKKPWEIGKSFDNSALVSHRIRLRNRALHQGRDHAQGQRPDQAIERPREHDLERCRAGREPSQYYELFPGDIIYSGTPENDGPVVRGDVMTGHIDGLYDINVRVV